MGDEIAQDGRNNACRAVRRSGDDPVSRGVLLVDGEGEKVDPVHRAHRIGRGGDPRPRVTRSPLPRFGGRGDRWAEEAPGELSGERLRTAGDVEPSGQDARRRCSRVHAVEHRVGDAVKVGVQGLAGAHRFLVGAHQLCDALALRGALGQ